MFVEYQVPVGADENRVPPGGGTELVDQERGRTGLVLAIESQDGLLLHALEELAERDDHHLVRDQQHPLLGVPRTGCRMKEWTRRLTSAYDSPPGGR